MKKRNILLIAAGSFLILLFWFMQRSCKGHQALQRTFKTVIAKPDSLQYYRDENNRLHAILHNTEIDQRYATEVMGDSIKALARIIRVKEKQIEGMTHITAQSAESYNVHILPNAHGLPSFDFKTDYRHMVGVWNSENVAITDTNTVPLDIVPYWKRKHSFLGIGYGAIEHYIDISSPNKTVKITKAENVVFKMKAPGRLGIGPYVGIDATGKPSIGIGFFYSVIRF